MMKKLILIIAVLTMAGCGTTGLVRSILSAKPTADVSEVASAVQTAQNMHVLVLMGGIAVIAGIGFMFASNAIFPGSSKLGSGIAAGGAGCIAISIFAPALQKIALPLIIVVVSLAGLWLAWRVYKNISGRR